MDDKGTFRDGESFEIRSSERGASLLLRRYQSSIIAEFDASGMSAATQVYLLVGCDGLTYSGAVSLRAGEAGKVYAPGSL